MKRLDNEGWLQDFCPEHRPEEYIQYLWGLQVDNGEYKLNEDGIYYENKNIR